MSGRVYLVGAGPGDPELITVKGQRLLAGADSILYDNLANPALLALARPEAERVYVGKKRSQHEFTQDEIVDMLVERARRGNQVVRLKGGDPFIFGRGGEEVEGLVAAGIEFEVVPGVTTPLGIAAYTGVPLTHREHTSAVTFVTGHDVEGIDWAKTGASETVVLFMGLIHLREICERLISGGRSPDTPAMAVRWATRPDQMTVTGTLATLPEQVEAVHLTPPTTVVIGDVVKLQNRLNWFERRPLFGKRIIVTRASAQAGSLASMLRDLGAEPVELPVIELAPLEDYARLDSCIANLPEYDWVVFTSINAVDFFFRRIPDVRAIRGRICAIGPATKDAIERLRLNVDLMPQESISEAVAAAFAGYDLKCKRVLLPRAAAAREVIPEALIRLGAQVDVADAYRNIIPLDAERRIREYLASERRAHWITFTSGSTVKNWLALAGRRSLEGIRVATIGPATTEVAVKHGIEVTVEADPHTMEGLVKAIASHRP